MIYLLIKRELWLKGTVATAIVALVIHWMATPVSGLGIAVPVFMPVIVTAIVAVMLSRDDSAPLSRLWLYSIILSALTSTVDGILRSSAFAVFWLIHNSSVVGNSTGKSAGLAPFSILSTKYAVRR